MMARTRLVARDTTRLAEIEIARQLAQDDEVHPADDLGLQRRGVQEFGIEKDGPEIGIERKRLAQLQ